MEAKAPKVGSKNGAKIGPSKDAPNEPQGLQKGAKMEPKGVQNMININEKTESEMEPETEPKSNGFGEAKTMKTIKRSSFSWFKDIQEKHGK